MRQFAAAFFQFIKTETRMSKREKPKTAVATKTEKPEILSAKTEKPISKVTKTAKPKNPMSPSRKDDCFNADKILLKCILHECLHAVLYRIRNAQVFKTHDSSSPLPLLNSVFHLSYNIRRAF